MAKRILNMTAEEMTHATKSELIEAIAGSEGRVLASETIGITIPLLTDVTNAEFAASMGADLILLNMFDVQEPKIMALPEVEKEETVREVKRLTGRMVGINLEPVEEVLPQLSVIIVISHVPQLCFKQLPATSSIHCTFYHF